MTALEQYVLDDQMATEPWLMVGLSPRAWYEAHRASFELDQERIDGAIRPYDLYARQPGRSGVYFLYDDCGVLLYVGKTHCFNQRLSLHARYGHVPFSHYSFVEVPAELAARAEDFYLVREKTPFNIKGPSCRH